MPTSITSASCSAWNMQQFSRAYHTYIELNPSLSFACTQSSLSVISQSIEADILSCHKPGYEPSCSSQIPDTLPRTSKVQDIPDSLSPAMEAIFCNSMTLEEPMEVIHKETNHQSDVPPSNRLHMPNYPEPNTIRPSFSVNELNLPSAP
jgi:hypothetical protein